MSKKGSCTLYLVIMSIILLGGCVSNINPVLKGSYQSEQVDGYIVQMSFQQDDNSFIKYIDNREVDKGNYEEVKKGVYKINGAIQEFEIILNRNNSFDIIIKKLNNGNTIEMENIDNTPVYFSTIFDDEDEYIFLLK